MSKVYFVGGYYKDCEVENEWERIDDIFECPEIFDIENVLKMGFIGDFVDEYNSENEITDEENENYLVDAWNLLNEEEKAKELIELMIGDELAGLIQCESLEKANEVLKYELSRLNELEEEFEVTGKVQKDNDYVELYEKKEARKAKILVSKTGGNASANSFNWRVSIPNAWISELKVTKEDREIEMTFDSKNKRIIIQK